MNKLNKDNYEDLQSLFKKALEIAPNVPICPLIYFGWTSAHRFLARIDNLPKELIEHACLWEISLLIWGNDPVANPQETYFELCNEFSIQPVSSINLAKIKSLDYDISELKMEELQRTVEAIGISPVSKNAFLNNINDILKTKGGISFGGN